MKAKKGEQACKSEILFAAFYSLMVWVTNVAVSGSMRRRRAAESNLRLTVELLSAVISARIVVKLDLYS